MGVLVQFLTFPLAPVRGVVWVVDKVVEAAERDYYDPEPVQAQLAELERARAEGHIEEEEFERQEDELLARLEESKAYQLRRGAQGGA
ncbi:hypothetical protein F7Q99_31775 [Streptomyces kaniharaensis]|uniref:Gas vesicle protein n=1 Tax=Streptomyces kaniharaensis TaxID=212423 RepID=A0A6N7L0J1_9ACTN|nr:gas vesicle protein GvpG [Streptomyces kaniharaensis]MQS16645.1 hypothetical protein [Streptomyces kaniharaensis]